MLDLLFNDGNDDDDVDSIFHWMTNVNPDGECFVYDFLLMWVLLMLMESVLLTAIEVMKNDFLCTTFGLVFLGMCMAFCGFFRKVEASPSWINWMCYVFPLRVSRRSIFLLHAGFLIFSFFISSLPFIFAVGLRWIHVPDLPHSRLHHLRCSGDGALIWRLDLERLLRPR
jgi:hypothetical protein